MSQKHQTSVIIYFLHCTHFILWFPQNVSQCFRLLTHSTKVTNQFDLNHRMLCFEGRLQQIFIHAQPPNVLWQ